MFKTEASGILGFVFRRRLDAYFHYLRFENERVVAALQHFFEFCRALTRHFLSLRRQFHQLFERCRRRRSTSRGLEDAHRAADFTRIQRLFRRRPRPAPFGLLSRIVAKPCRFPREGAFHFRGDLHEPHELAVFTERREFGPDFFLFLAFDTFRFERACAWLQMPRPFARRLPRCGLLPRRNA